MSRMKFFIACLLFLLMCLGAFVFSCKPAKKSSGDSSSSISENAMIESLVRKFLYYPTLHPKNAPLPYWAESATEVSFPATDNNEIYALYWAAKPGRPMILFFHGNAQSAFEWALIHEEFRQLDAGLLLVDYPGYGKSSGKPTEQGLYAAGEAAYQWLVKNQGFDPSKIIVFGKSLGGGVASKVARDHEVMALILESTFTSVPAVAKILLPMLPGDALFKSERYETIGRIGNIHIPVLVIHGDEDNLIPMKEGKALYDAANEPKKLYVVKGAGHNDVSMVAGNLYGATLKKWLDGISH